MKNTKIIFMGTPIFAAEILRKLISEGYDVIGVVSQPDRKSGRKQEMYPTPTKEVALEHDIPVFQPEKIREDLSFFKEHTPDLIITAAFGQIIPQELLDIPPLGCINVHGSLLPKYRGGAPIHYSVINGDVETGVTIMEMVAKMDAGNIISQRKFPISFISTTGDVHDKMISVAQELLIDTLPDIINQTYTSIPQNEEEVTFSPNIKPDQEKIDWSRSAMDIYNQIRGLNPWPVAYSTITNKRFKFYTTRYIQLLSSKQIKFESGTIISIDTEGILIAGNNGNLLVSEFQIEGKRKTNIKDFIHGNTILKPGMKFR